MQNVIFLFKITVVCVFLLFSRQLDAAVHMMSQLDARDGLGSNRIVSLFTDQKGFVWISEGYGVSVYDGISVKRIELANVKLAEHDYVLGKYNQSLVLAIGYEGLFRVNPDSASVTKIFDTSSDSVYVDQDIFVVDFLEEDNGDVLIATDKRLVLVKSDLSIIELFNFDSVLPYEVGINAIVKVEQQILIGTSQGLYVYDLQQRNVVAVKHPHYNKVYSLSVVGEYLLIGYNKGLTSTPVSALQLANVDDVLVRHERLIGLNGPYVFTNNQTRFYAGNEHGIHYFEPAHNKLVKLFTLPELKSDIHSKTILSLTLDSLGRLWIGTEADGVLIWDSAGIPFKVLSYNAYDERTLPDNNIWHIENDPTSQSQFWISTSEGLARVNHKKNTVQRISVAQPQQEQAYSLMSELHNVKQRILSFDISKTGMLWFGMSRELKKYNIQTEEFEKLNVTENIALLIDKSEGRFKLSADGMLWLMLWNETLEEPEVVSVDLTDMTVEQHPSINQAIASKGAFLNIFTPYPELKSIVVTINGELLIYDYGNKTVTNTFVVPDIPSSTDEKYITSIRYYAAENAFWVTSAGHGAYQLDATTLNVKRRLVGENLPFNNVAWDTQIDKRGNIWLSSNSGLSRIAADSNNIAQFNVSSGLPTNEFIEGSSTVLNDGTLVFGSTAGLVYFDPSSTVDESNVTNSGVYFLDFDKDTDEFSTLSWLLDSPTDITLSEQDKAIMLTVASPLAFGRSDMVYRYKLLSDGKLLEGVSDGPTITLPRLSWGHHSLMVEYNDPANGKLVTSDVMSITVLRPFWASWVAIALYCIVAVVSVWLLWHLSSSTVIKQNRKINGLIRERTKQLQLANSKLALTVEQLEVANLTKDRFLANMSHEIRTPLTTIMGYTDIIERQPMQDGRVPSSIRHIKTSSIHLLNVINSILDLSKLNADTFELVYSDTSLKALLNEVSLPIGHMSEDKGLVFKVSIANALPEYIISDATRMKQVLLNLCTNAVKFTDYGCVELAVKHHKGSLFFDVIDTGIGISELDKESLFVPFERTNNPRVKQSYGVGLGLNISKKISRAFGGNIELISRVAKGSTFRFSVPLQTVTDTAWFTDVNEDIDPNLGFNNNSILNPSVTPAINNHKHHKLLIVDDYEVNLELAKLLLRDYEFPVVTAKSGSEALKILAVDPDVKLVLLDIQMPAMDGYETLGEIHKLNNSLPVLAFTANNMTHEIDSYHHAGFVGHVSKPIILEQLLLQIHTHLGIHKINEVSCS